MEQLRNFLTKNPVSLKINRFVNSNTYMFIIGLLVILSSSFAIELILWPFISLLGVLALIFSKDAKPLISVVLLFLMSLSYENGLSYNKYPDQPNIFDLPWVIPYAAFWIGIVIITAVFNFIVYKQYKHICRRSLHLLPGLIVLGISYLTAGFFSPNYSFNNLLFSFTNAAMVIGIVLYFGEMAFQEKDCDVLKYISMFMVVTSLVISIQVFHIYLTNNVIQNGEIDKLLIVNGWACHNNFAGYLNLAMPFIFYLIVKEKNPLPYLLLTVLISIVCILTMSRNGLLILILELILSFILYCKIKKVKAKNILIISSIGLAIIGVFSIIFYQKLADLFNSLINLGISLNGRDILWELGFSQFKEYPIFGVGWFKCTNEWENHIPPNSFAPSLKYHNILVQLLAGCGLVGLLGFIIFITHLSYKTFKKISHEKLYLYVAFIVVIVSSILDNFFFDYSFERYYAIFLVGISYFIDVDKYGKSVN